MLANALLVQNEAMCFGIALTGPTIVGDLHPQTVNRVVVLLPEARQKQVLPD